jgi:hypothetical protein
MLLSRRVSIDTDFAGQPARARQTHAKHTNLVEVLRTVSGPARRGSKRSNTLDGRRSGDGSTGGMNCAGSRGAASASYRLQTRGSGPLRRNEPARECLVLVPGDPETIIHSTVRGGCSESSR